MFKAYVRAWVIALVLVLGWCALASWLDMVDVHNMQCRSVHCT